MNKLATMQDSWASESDPAVICSFDYEAIQKPTIVRILNCIKIIYSHFEKSSNKRSHKPPMTHYNHIVIFLLFIFIYFSKEAINK